MKKIMFATLALTALVASNAGAHGSNPYLKAIMAEGINLDVRQATAVLAPIPNNRPQETARLKIAAERADSAKRWVQMIVESVNRDLGEIDDANDIATIAARENYLPPGWDELISGNNVEPAKERIRQYVQKLEQLVPVLEQLRAAAAGAHAQAPAVRDFSPLVAAKNALDAFKQEAHRIFIPQE